jgi:DNA-binding MarR family transcriptional regulator
VAEPAEPRWLDAEEEQAWLALVAVLLTLPAALDARLQREAGMTFYEYVVLAALSRSPERTRRMTDLAVLTNGSLPRLSQVVTKLEARGWVARFKDPHNARSTLARLTDSGWKVLVRTAPGHVEAVRRLVFDPLTPAQVRQMRTLHRRIKAAIGTESPLLP